MLLPRRHRPHCFQGWTALFDGAFQALRHDAGRRNHQNAVHSDADHHPRYVHTASILSLGHLQINVKLHLSGDPIRDPWNRHQPLTVHSHIPICFFQSLSDGFVMAPHRRSSPQAVLKDKSPSFSFSA